MKIMLPMLKRYTNYDFREVFRISVLVGKI
jgi:hypothetical protein